MWKTLLNIVGIHKSINLVCRVIHCSCTSCMFLCAAANVSPFFLLFRSVSFFFSYVCVYAIFGCWKHANEKWKKEKSIISKHASSFKPYTSRTIGCGNTLMCGSTQHIDIKHVSFCFSSHFTNVLLCIIHDPIFYYIASASRALWNLRHRCLNSILLRADIFRCIL